MLAILSSRRRAALTAGAVALLAVAVYASTIGHEFVFDDNPEVVDNEGIRSLRNLPSFFGESAWKGAGEDNPIYRPLTTASYALNHAVSGLEPWSYHLVNVVLHAVVSVLVLVFALELGLPALAAFGGAALFAVHPIHVEAVANVAGRKDLLTAVFALLAVLAHVRATRRGGIAVVLAPLALLAAMFSKEAGLAVLGVLVARDILFGREEWSRAQRRFVGLYAAYAGAVAVYFVARWTAVGSLGVPLDHIPYAENPIAHVPAATRLVTAVAALGRGIALLVAPVTLSPDYSYAAIPPATGAGDPYLWLGLLAVVAAIATTILAWRRAPIVVLALAWYAATLFPASNLIVPIGTIFGERLLYLPSVGLSLLVGAALARAPGGLASTVARTAVAIVLVWFGWRTLVYAGVWHDELALFTWGEKVQPRSSKMQQCLGAALMERGRPAEAVPHFEAALAIVGDQAIPQSRHRLELGVAYEALDRPADAARVYLAILRDDPAYADAMWRLGVAQWAMGQRGAAVKSWERTVAVDPRHGRALSEIGIALWNEGNRGGARAMWERATVADPRLASAWYRLGNAYEQEGDLARARSAWSEFLNHAGAKLPREQAEIRRKLRGG